MKPYIESSITYLINTKLHKSQQNEPGNALYLRGIASLVVRVLTNAKLWKLLVKAFNQQDKSIVSPTAVLVFLLRLDDSDVIGEIVACHQLFHDVILFKGVDVKLFDILNESDTKRSFPKVTCFVHPSLLVFLLQYIICYNLNISILFVACIIIHSILGC